MAGTQEFGTVQDLLVAVVNGSFQPLILVGAGISSDAGAPLFRQFNKHLAAAALGGLAFDDTKIGTVANVIRPESLMSRIVRYLGEDSLTAYQALDCEPDHNHEFLVRAIENGCHVVTPNLDMAIEKASRNGLEPSYTPDHYRSAAARIEQGLDLVPGLWKYHGTLGRKDGLPAATIEDVGGSFFPEKAAVIRHLIETRPFVVFGYSGRDHFSFQKLLATTRSIHPVYWIEFERGDDTGPSGWNRIDASKITAELSANFARKKLPGRIEESVEAWEEWVKIQKWAALKSRSEVRLAKADTSKMIHTLLKPDQTFAAADSASIELRHFSPIMDASTDRKQALWIHLRRDLGIPVDDSEMGPKGKAITCAQVLAFARILREDQRFPASVQLIDEFLGSGPSLTVDEEVDLILSRTEADRLSSDSTQADVEQKLKELQSNFGNKIGKLSARRFAAQQALVRKDHTRTWNDARKLGEKGIELAQGNPEQTATALNTHANVLLGAGAPTDAGLPDKAIELLADAIAINQDLWNHHALFQNYRTMSIACQRKFKHENTEGRVQIRTAAIQAAQRCVDHAVLAAGSGRKGEINTARNTLQHAQNLGAESMAD